MSRPLYSICICNYNMSNTLESSLKSVLNQLDHDFEVVVVDDGSSDDSLDKLYLLKNSYENLRIIPLLRDKRRKLGETRNISVRAANGKYVILHIDTDDLWDPYIKSFTKIYHEIEKRLDIENFMLSGKQIHMSTKSLVIDNPYPNVYYCEDRYFFNNLSVLGKLFMLDHKVFMKRMSLSVKQKIIKLLNSQFALLQASFSYASNTEKIFITYLKDIFIERKLSLKLSIIILILLIPSYLMGKFFKRASLFNQYKVDYKKYLFIDLLKIENQTKEEYGLYKLENFERAIYKLD